MSDDTLTGKIIGAVKTSTYGDNYPVFKPDLNFHTEFHAESIGPLYNDVHSSDDGWYNSEIVPCDPIRTNYHHERNNFGLGPSKIRDININQVLSDHHSESNSFEEQAYDKASQLLANCLHRTDHSREYLETAINLIEEYSLANFGHLCRGLVYFPDLLGRFLNIQRQKSSDPIEMISEDNLGVMIARCIEHAPTDTYATESLEHLLNFKGDAPLEIKLLPGKYNIDSELYDLAVSCNVHDSYYGAVIQGIPYIYSHQDVVSKEQTGQYTGFRDAYHCLLYGGKEHLQACIVRWDLWGDDCTANAAREFFHLDKSCSIEIVKNHINNKCANNSALPYFDF